MSDDRFLMPEELWLGQPSIDAQHAVLFALFDEVKRALRDHTEGFAMGFVLAGLRTYTKTHFKFEETMMSPDGYSGRTAHLVEHRAFEKQVESLGDRFLAIHDPDEKHQLAEETQAFLYSWLANHITVIDKKFCKILEGRASI
ncbi:MAG: hemerythrin family protein [Magnetococcales bacterium]|nr:hemerythrin family protein [Magnetococcales bacterium]MBF0321877.1 hemerythrin family protein [Magnetococcales bacterium]